ncbi:hypothetical protein QJS04_geneDACA001589 [Acorus gramineus]|uniref:DUF7086 domain-containing protein n=1 Tax=Acorus gramineus TaxID=55184 RepID=A0AAV9BIL6_ACOGR|nr:hypothetical protein QJS04_geneDACA001589 [Acorus gramineus]
MAQPDPFDPDYIPSPYPWSRPRRASVHTLHHLLSSGCDTITGRLRCKRCDVTVEVAHDLRDRFMEVARFVSAERPRMHDRAPPVWMKPRLPTCQNCGYANAMKPVIAPKKRNINWLFLLLGQMLGCCSLAQLKYFCKHNSNHRTGAKDRVLYLTYLNLCKQLDPTGPFDR